MKERRTAKEDKVVVVRRKKDLDSRKREKGSFMWQLEEDTGRRCDLEEGGEPVDSLLVCGQILVLRMN